MSMMVQSGRFGVPLSLVPKWSGAITGSNIALSNNNQTALNTNGVGGYTTAGNGAASSSKFYVEATLHKVINSIMGIFNATYTIAMSSTTLGETVNGIGWHSNTGNIRYNAGTLATPGTVANGDTVMIAGDPASSLVWFGKNGTWQGDPAAGTGGYSVPSIGGAYVGNGSFFTGDGATLRSSNDLLYAIPSGFAALV